MGACLRAGAQTPASNACRAGRLRKQLLPELPTVLCARDTSRLVARVLTARAATKILLQLQETDLFVHRWFGEFCMENPPNQVAVASLGCQLWSYIHQAHVLLTSPIANQQTKYMPADAG